MALAGEMLGARREPGGLQAADARRAEARHEVWILAVGANADVRAISLGEHVEHGAEAHVHAQAPELAALDDALSLDEALVRRHARGQVIGEDRDLPAQHDDAAALVVRR